MTNRKLIIGTRGSTLALWQARFVQDKLKEQGQSSVIQIIKTTGDQKLGPLSEIGGKGLFIKELEVALLDKKIDIAVHSLKDMPAKLPEPFELVTFLPRHDPRDLMIFHKSIFQKFTEIDEINEKNCPNIKFTCGTSSPRRAALLKKTFPKIVIKELRGNVDSRLAKLDDHEFDAIILAKAALDRLNITGHYDAIPVSVETIPPCATQGIIAIETTSHHDFDRTALQALNCKNTQEAASFERKILEKIGAACTTPIGVYTDLNKIFIKWQKEKKITHWHDDFKDYSLEAITNQLLD